MAKTKIVITVGKKNVSMKAKKITLDTLIQARIAINNAIDYYNTKDEQDMIEEMVNGMFEG